MKKKLSRSSKTGVIAVVFLIIGFESASFLGKVLGGISSSQSAEVAVSDTAREARLDSAVTDNTGNPNHSIIEKVRYGREKESLPEKSEAETFAFNPNTASLTDLQRLGLSERQAQSIINYRTKGGRFRRREDFARSYVVSDSLYERLKEYIIIPLVDINRADSSEFDGLPGIGPYYAAKMVEYRTQLKGYSYKEQLMEIWKFDEDRFKGLEDLIEVGPAAPYRIWSLPEDSLATHPYIGRYAAHSIVLYRENTPPEEWSVSNLLSAGILKPENAARLSKCRLE